MGAPERRSARAAARLALGLPHRVWTSRCLLRPALAGRPAPHAPLTLLGLLLGASIPRNKTHHRLHCHPTRLRRSSPARATLATLDLDIARGRSKGRAVPL